MVVTNWERLMPFWLRKGWEPTLKKGKCTGCGRVILKKNNDGTTFKDNCSFCKAQKLNKRTANNETSKV